MVHSIIVNKEQFYEISTALIISEKWSKVKINEDLWDQLVIIDKQIRGVE